MIDVKIKGEEDTALIYMSNMNPYDIGKIVDDDSELDGRLVMRTATTIGFEVM